MRRCSHMVGSSKPVPPFFGRQIRQRSRSLIRLFEYKPGAELAVNECPTQFRRILRKVFQGIHVPKTCCAAMAAELFNNAKAAGNSAILKFITMGMQAVECRHCGEMIQLTLVPVGDERKSVTLRDYPAAFVSR